MDIWPNFFIVGAQKAGSTSLYEYLKNMPEIYMSPIKEPSFFSVKIIPENHPQEAIRDKKEYLKLFEKVKDEKIIGEASPTYLADPEAPNRSAASRNRSASRLGPGPPLVARSGRRRRAGRSVPKRRVRAPRLQPAPARPCPRHRCGAAATACRCAGRDAAPGTRGAAASGAERCRA